MSRDRAGTANGIPPPRPYDAPKRQAAARETRRRIRSAATDLLLAQGYAATSMRAVALAAGVAEKTVYLQYATKTALLKEVVETAIVGDDDDVPVAARGWFTDALGEPDPRAKLHLIVDGTTALHERTGPMFSVARGAAAVDPDVAQLWHAGKKGHRADMGRLATALGEARMIPPERDVEWARAVLCSACADHRIDSTACARVSPAMSVNQTRASMPIALRTASASACTPESLSWSRTGSKASAIHGMARP